MRVCESPLKWLSPDVLLNIVDCASRNNELWWLGLRAVDKSIHATVREALKKSNRSRRHVVEALEVSFSKFSRHSDFCRDALHYLRAISKQEAWMVTATSSMIHWFNQPVLRFSRLYGSDVIFVKQVNLLAWLVVQGLRTNHAAGPITFGVLGSKFINDLRNTKGGSAGSCKIQILCNALCEAMQRARFNETYVRAVVGEMIRLVHDDAELVSGLKSDACINRISLE